MDGAFQLTDSSTGSVLQQARRMLLPGEGPGSCSAASCARNADAEGGLALPLLDRLDQEVQDDGGSAGTAESMRQLLQSDSAAGAATFMTVQLRLSHDRMAVTGSGPSAAVAAFSLAALAAPLSAQISSMINATGSSQGSRLIGNVTLMERLGVCGNGICEVGERHLQDGWGAAIHMADVPCPEVMALQLHHVAINCFVLHVRLSHMIDVA
jgi:hypothetical protein